MTDKKGFYNTPVDVQKEEEHIEKETEKQAVIEQEIAKAEAPPIGETVKELAFWLLLVIVLVTYGIKVFQYVRYITINNAEVEFTRNHPEYTKAVRKQYEYIHQEADKLLIEKFCENGKYCEK